MASWNPSLPWPSTTPGGAHAPAWGGYVKLWVRAALAAGASFHMGAHPNDRLTAGNVLAGAPPAQLDDDEVLAASPIARLWVDLSCDVLDVDVQGGATSSSGVFTRPDAATATVTLADPTRKYDPLNSDSPYALGGRSRLVPGTPVQIFAEVVNGDTGAVTTHYLFTGTADSWAQDWNPHPSSRRTQLVATDATKAFVNANRPDVDPPVGPGETVAQRVQRIVNYVPWNGAIVAGVGTVTLDPTAHSGDAWTQLNHALDDEIGYVHFTTDGKLRWVGRATWSTIGPPVISLGCGAGLHDVLVDASPAALGAQIRNAIFAGRPDGVLQTLASTSSIARYGRYDYSRTDLGLASDAQCATWAQTVLQLYAFPQIELADVTFRPAIDARSWEVWRAALSIAFVSDIARVVWAPPDRPLDDPIDAHARVVGFAHTITRGGWELKWQLVDANALAYSGAIFTLGPHANDRLDAAFVMA